MVVFDVGTTPSLHRDLAMQNRTAWAHFLQHAITPCSLSVLSRSAKITFLDSAQGICHMQGRQVICKAARARSLTRRYRGTSTRLRKARLMARQHHHAAYARIQDPMVHNRSCLHRLGSNAGPVEPGVLDPDGICPFALAALLRHRGQKKSSLLPFGHRSLGNATDAVR